MRSNIVEDYLVKEGEYWVVYRKSAGFSTDCPIYKTKDKKQAEILLQ